MRPRLNLLFCWMVALVVLCSARATPTFAQSASRSKTRFAYSQPFHTQSGIVVLGYAPATRAEIVMQGGKTVWEGGVMNTHLFRFHLMPGNYELRSDDEIKIISNDLAAYDAPSIDQVMKKINAAGKPGAKGMHYMGTSGPVTVVPVPRVSTPHYAENPPSQTADRHVILSGVSTTLKATVLNGTAPYQITWNPGDGTGNINLGSSTDGYNFPAVTHTYTGNVGDLLNATITVVDSTNATAVGHYYMIIGDPGSQGDRIARSTDEALWYLHTQIARYNNYAANGEPSYNGGKIDNRISSSAMAAICYEQTGHSITGGLNFSNDPTKDAYVDDLNRLINYLTDAGILQQVNVGAATKTYAGIGTFNMDTHGPGGASNGIALVPSSGSTYDVGMHIQAIAQAGFTDEAVPNRTEYASYYDLIGDYVDAIQIAQGNSGGPEGGWRYTTNGSFQNDSDGSTAAWACIGLEAATRANALTPGTPAHSPIVIAPSVIAALRNYWTVYDQVSDKTITFGNYDYRKNPDYFNDHYFGGFGYNSNTYITNPGKTGGGIVSLKLAGYTNNDPKVIAAEGFLYRNFWCPDLASPGNQNWNSARDAYGMYNILKGLTGAQVTGANSLLTDTAGSGGNDLDGNPLAPFDWFEVLANDIAGTSDTDLGHQAWAGNTTFTSRYFSNANDGHYEPNGTRGPIAPFIYGEWTPGSSDSNAGINLVTAWELAVLVGTVFTPPPVAVINHPSAATNEIYIPIVIQGVPFSATFDPGASYETNPAATITSVTWDFGDGSPNVTYTLPQQGPVGGMVPVNTGLLPSGDEVQHHYTTLGDKTVTLTVTDSAGNSGSTNLIVHVISSPYSPVAGLTFSSTDTGQSGNTVGIIDAGPNIGQVTLKFDGTASHNPDPTSVNSPKNAQGISAFLWEWPTAPVNTVTGDTPPSVNAGGSPSDTMFQEGALDTSGQLNTGSKAGVETYIFNFGSNPANWPTSLIVKLQVKSNITQTTPGVPPNTDTISQQILLAPNSSLTTTRPSIKNVTVHNISDTTAIISFDTVDQFGNALATTANIGYGLVAGPPYGSSKSDPSGIHHDMVLTGLTAGTTYHYGITVTTGGGVTASTVDSMLKTLPPGTPILGYLILSHSTSGSTETVTIRVTNTGPGDALNFTATTFLANRGVTLPAGTTFGGAGTTIPAGGGTYNMTLNFTLPANFAFTSFMTKFAYSYTNSASTHSAGTAQLTVPYP